MKITLMVGPPGSGKSTYARNYASYNEEMIYINQDSQGKDEHFQIFLNALKNKKDIIVDRMGFSKEQRERYLVPAKDAGYKIDIVVFHIDFEDAMKRCMLRLEKQRHETIKNEKDASRALNFFFSKYERVEDNEANTVWREYSGQSRVGGTHVVEPCIVIDIDGTLANINHRLLYVKGEGKKDWKNFFHNIPYDSPNDWCVEIINRFKDTHKIVLASGRPDDHKKVTEDWLKEHNIHYDNLFMRRRGDFRPDTIVKEIIYEFDIKTKFKPLFVVDDRASVVDMWRKHGLTVLACAEGEF